MKLGKASGGRALPPCLVTTTSPNLSSNSITFCEDLQSVKRHGRITTRKCKQVTLIECEVAEIHIGRCGNFSLPF